MPQAVERLPKLSHKQQKFLSAYLDGTNGTKAAEIAGYSIPEQSAHDLLKSPKIALHLAHHRKKAQKEDGASRRYKRERLRNIMEGDDDKLAMLAMEIDNKMQQEYVQRVQMSYEGMDNEQLDEECAEIMQGNGWICFPPEHPRAKEALELLE